MTHKRVMQSTFQSTLMELKRSLGMTQAELAAKLEVSKRTVELWLSGQRVPLAVTQEGVVSRLAAKPHSVRKGRAEVEIWPKDKTASHSVRQGRNEPCSCGSGRKFKKCCGFGLKALRP